ncbi:MAG TPA: HNH endonuclease [Aquella sp.]|nr:HNH endonuclease [Aquella sp.]
MFDNLQYYRDHKSDYVNRQKKRRHKLKILKWSSSETKYKGRGIKREYRYIVNKETGIEELCRLCYKCNEWLVFSSFYASNVGDGLQSKCKDCEKKYRIENLESRRAISRNYNRRNKERLVTCNRLYRQTIKGKAVLKASSIKRRTSLGSFTAKEFIDRFNEQEGLCAWCSISLEFAQATVDHFIPILKSGTNYIDNIFACCKSCNSSKNSKMPWDFKAFKPIDLVINKIKKFVPMVIDHVL